MRPQPPASGSLKERAIDTAWSFFLVDTVGFTASLLVGGLVSEWVAPADYLVALTFTEIFVFTCIGFLVAGVATLGLLGPGPRALVDGSLAAIREEFNQLQGKEQDLKLKADSQGSAVRRLEAELARAQDEYNETAGQLAEVEAKKGDLRKRFAEEDRS